MKKKKKSVAKVHLTHLRLFKSDVSLVVGTYEQLKDWVREALTEEKKSWFLPWLDRETPESTLLGRTYNLRGGGSVIWLSKYDEPTFVHELVHAVGNLFEEKGMSLSRETEETYAYLIQDLHNQLRMH